MKREQAIEKIKEYINSKPFEWETIYHCDESPVDKGLYWVFKNLWEPRDALRGNEISSDSLQPFLIIKKSSGEIREVSISEYDKIFNS